MERRKVSNVCGKFEPGHSISYKIACAPSEDSGQPAYLRKQVRIFLVRLKTLWIIDYRDSVLRRLSFGSEVIKLFSCSTQLNMKFSLLINMKMPTIVEKISCPALFSKKEFAIVSSLRLISRTNFMFNWVKHEKKFYNLGARLRGCSGWSEPLLGAHAIL